MSAVPTDALAGSSAPPPAPCADPSSRARPSGEQRRLIGHDLGNHVSADPVRVAVGTLRRPVAAAGSRRTRADPVTLRLAADVPVIAAAVTAPHTNVRAVRPSRQHRTAAATAEQIHTATDQLGGAVGTGRRISHGFAFRYGRRDQLGTGDSRGAVGWRTGRRVRLGMTDSAP